MEKICSQCNKTKPATLQFFHKKLKGLANVCKECVSIEKKRYQLDKKSEISFRRRNKRVNNLVETRTKDRQRYLKDKVKRVKTTTKRCIQRYREDPVFKTRKNISKQLRMVITGYRIYTENSKMYNIVGITGMELFEYLWKGFEMKYNTSRCQINIQDLHIDHIMPLITAKTVEDVIRLNYYTNLQLLTREDNIKKSTTIPDNLVKRSIK